MPLVRIVKVDNKETVQQLVRLNNLIEDLLISQGVPFRGQLPLDTNPSELFYSDEEQEIIDDKKATMGYWKKE